MEFSVCKFEHLNKESRATSRNPQLVDADTQALYLAIFHSDFDSLQKVLSTMDPCLEKCIVSFDDMSDGIQNASFIYCDPMLIALHTCDDPRIFELLKKSSWAPDLNHKDFDYIGASIENENSTRELINFAIDIGQDINQEKRFLNHFALRPPIFSAISSDKLWALECLIENGANIADSKYKHLYVKKEKNLFEFAIYSKSMEFVNYLINKGFSSEINFKELLHDKSFTEGFSMQMIRSGFDIFDNGNNDFFENKKGYLNISGCQDLIVSLIAAGATSKDPEINRELALYEFASLTPIAASIESNNADALMHWLEKGVDCNEAYTHRIPALHGESIIRYENYIEFAEETGKVDLAQMMRAFNAKKVAEETLKSMLGMVI